MMTWGDYLYVNKCECPYCGWEKRVRDMDWVYDVGFVCIECINEED